MVGMQMFGSVSSILRVDVDDVVREQNCNMVCRGYVFVVWQIVNAYV